MSATPYPLPRETRESTVLVGNGTAGPYGPTLFKVFDTADVVVLTKAAGADFYASAAGVTVTKTGGQSFDTVSVTFAAPVPDTTSIVIQSRRTHERSVSVFKGTTLASEHLERELSKQGSVLEELRRDIGRSLAVDPAQTAPRVKVGAVGDALVADASGNLIPGTNLPGLVAALAAEVAARIAGDASLTTLIASTVAYEALLRAAGDDALRSLIGAAGYIGDRVFATRTAASLATISVQVDSIVTLARLTRGDRGRAEYRRVSLADLTGFPASSYFRSADRFMPGGGTDAVNGGYWLLDDAEPSVMAFGVRPTTSWDATQAALNDTAMTEACLYAAKVGCLLHVGPGTYYFAAGFETPATGSYYRMDTNFGLVGSGPGTVFTRNDTAAADYTSNTTLRAGACMRQHSANLVLENIRFLDCAVAIYRGQKPGQPVSGGDGGNTSPAHSRFRNVWIQNCGTGILDAAAGGNHYNWHQGVHIWQCQIGYHSREGDAPGGVGPMLSNANRNMLQGRIARNWIGYLLENSSGTTIQGYGEKQKIDSPAVAPSNNRYSYPSGVMNGGGSPDALLSSKPCAIYIGPYSNQTQIVHFFNEDSDWVLYNAGFATQITGGDFDENSVPSNCIFVTKPGFLVTHTTFFHSNGLHNFSNPSTELGGTDKSRSATWHLTNFLDHHPGAREAEYFQRSSGAPTKALRRRFVLDGGTFGNPETKLFDLQTSADNAEGSTGWDITVVGHSNAGNFSHVASFLGASHRGGSTITRHYGQHKGQVRATGLGAGSYTDDATAPVTANNFTLAFAVSGTTLQLSVTSPSASPLSRCTIFVEETRAVE